MIDPEEQAAIDELKSMSREELDKVPYDLKKWRCQVKGCHNGVGIRDYGISPFFFINRKHGDWNDLTYWIYVCGKHLKRVKKCEKIYSNHQMWNHVYDNTLCAKTKVIDQPVTKHPKKIKQSNTKSIYSEY